MSSLGKSYHWLRLALFCEAIPPLQKVPWNHCMHAWKLEIWQKLFCAIGCDGFCRTTWYLWVCLCVSVNLRHHACFCVCVCVSAFSCVSVSVSLHYNACLCMCVCVAVKQVVHGDLEIVPWSGNFPISSHDFAHVVTKKLSGKRKKITLDTRANLFMNVLHDRRGKNELKARECIHYKLM